jgi:hypothetical protein
MESNELRIGNLVHDYDEELIIVSGISYGDVYSLKLGETPLARIKPIPLTEEWLIKFGFEEDGINWYWFNTKDRFTDYGYAYNTKTNIIEFNECELIGIRYVHQLQNLYFALTGQELNIK